MPDTENMGQYPPAPWQLQGRAVIHTQWLDAAAARQAVPPELALVTPVPGKTLGAVYFASYTAGSSLEYRELIVVPATVRCGMKVGIWISHIYVDHPQALAGGREIWALPKQEAEFVSAANGDVSITHADGELCVLQKVKPARSLPVPLPVFTSAISLRDHDALWFRASGSARIGTGSGQLYVPASSPFAALGFTGGRRIHLDQLDVLVRAPGEPRRQH